MSRDQRALGANNAPITLIAIAGDVFLGGQLTGENSSSIIHSKTYLTADQRILNLEHPITDNGTPAQKGILSTSSSGMESLLKLKPDAVTLANNHIHDMGIPGIRDTLQHLDDQGIGHTGAGRNLDEAAQPHWLTESLCLLSYCQFNAPTLRLVQPATETSAGMNPLSYERIAHDLDQLPSGSQAILYLHWGQEHLFLPAPDQVKLAKKLLTDSRVALIVGAHAHRIQGYLEHQGKRAYFCLGNFLFPNFLIEPPTTASAKTEIPTGTPITRRYHAVKKPTYKKWLLINRLSLLITYDVASGVIRHVPHYQDDNQPVVRELYGIPKTMTNGWIWILSQLVRLPPALYRPVQRANALFTSLGWRMNITGFQIKNNGLRWFLQRIRHKILKRATQ